MATIGSYAQLALIKRVDFGAYLDAGELGDVLLPKRYLDETMTIGSMVDVFIYADSNDIPIATTLKPRICAGQCAYLPVVDVNDAGAFLDWGLPKHLLAPFSEQHKRFTPGRSYVVYVYRDPYSDRVVASSRLSRHLSENGRSLKKGQAVELLICGHSDMGYKAVVNQQYLGLIFRDDAFKALNYGQSLTGYIKSIRSDGKIDLSLQPIGEQGRDRLQQKIIDYLNANEGHSTLNDKAAPEVIYREFNVSKGAYKKALGALYKQRLIIINADGVSLTDKK